MYICIAGISQFQATLETQYGHTSGPSPPQYISSGWRSCGSRQRWPPRGMGPLPQRQRRRVLRFKPPPGKIDQQKALLSRHPHPPNPKRIPIFLPRGILALRAVRRATRKLSRATRPRSMQGYAPVALLYCTGTGGWHMLDCRGLLRRVVLFMGGRHKSGQWEGEQKSLSVLQRGV